MRRGFWRSAVAAAGAGAVLVLVWPVTARAVDTDLATVAALADEARTDPAALDELRAVTSIDGSPVDMNAIVDVAAGSPRLLDTLAALPSGEAATPDRDPGEVARDILAGSDFSVGRVSEGSRSLLDRIVDLLNRILPEPFTGPVGLPLLILLLLGIGYLLWKRRGALAREREAGEGEAADPAVTSTAADLSSAADTAAAAGDFSAAVRLRFEAGIASLEGDGVFPDRDSVTTDSVRAIAPTAAAPVLDRFDAVAYGGSPATADDDATARDTWPAIVAGARRG